LKGNCGTVNSNAVVTPSPLCQIGNPSAIVGASPKYWTCTGEGPGEITAYCAVGLCGNKAGTTSVLPSSSSYYGTCGYGDTAALDIRPENHIYPYNNNDDDDLVNDSANWECKILYPGTSSYVKQRCSTVLLINAQCGSAKGRTFPASPASPSLAFPAGYSLCASLNTVVDLTEDSSKWSWRCRGHNSATAYYHYTYVDCSANKDLNN